MGKTNKARNLGRGSVTPKQVAYIVERYLLDHNFTKTQSMFREEASSLLSSSPAKTAPKTLMSLSTMLNEYVLLKEKKLLLDQERIRLEHENLRVRNLLQSVINTYNSSAIAPSSSPQIISSVFPANDTVLPTPYPVSFEGHRNQRTASVFVVDPASGNNRKRSRASDDLNAVNKYHNSPLFLPLHCSYAYLSLIYNHIYSISVAQVPQNSTSCAISDAPNSSSYPPNISKKSEICENVAPSDCAVNNISPGISSAMGATVQPSSSPYHAGTDLRDQIAVKLPSGDLIGALNSSPEPNLDTDFFDIDLPDFDALGADFVSDFLNFDADFSDIIFNSTMQASKSDNTISA